MTNTTMETFGAWLEADQAGGIRLKYVPLLMIGGLVVLLIVAVIASTLSNLGLPAGPVDDDRLSEVEKARLAEYFHLQDDVTGTVWPGAGPRPAWGETPIPAIVHNEAYAFLVGYPGTPPDGWTVPGGLQRGGAWEVVPDDEVLGAPYYRQALPPSGETPQNFTVLVGDVWVATLFTKAYAEVEFYEGFRLDLPGFLQPIFPYRLMWALLMGPTENYLGGLAHEAFHAYQGSVTPERLLAAERRPGAAYDWDAAREAWREELALLRDAAKAAHDAGTSEAEVREAARQWLAQREVRRTAQGLGELGLEFERQAEWLEGLAKYAELTLGPATQAAVGAGDHAPVSGLDADDEFRGYRTRERNWRQQLDQLTQMVNQGETRFYYTGFAQGVLLDRLLPGWKARAMDEGVWLEALVAEALRNE